MSILSKQMREYVGQDEDVHDTWDALFIEIAATLDAKDALLDEAIITLDIARLTLKGRDQTEREAHVLAAISAALTKLRAHISSDAGPMSSTDQVK